MDDLISRQAAIDRLTEYGNGRAVFISVGEAIIRIEQLPPAQPEQLSTNLAEVGTDCISRQAAIDALNRECCCGAVIDHCGLETAMDIISELPPAEPKRIRGRWTCDQCGYMNNIEGINFCPKCGRKM